MKTFLLLILSITTLSVNARSFECKSKDLTLAFSSQEEIVTIKHKNGETFEISVKESYDGRSLFSLITGEGVAITYSNHFGCIRRVELTSAIKLEEAPFRVGKVDFGTCSGGSTPDRLCRPDNFDN
ncbi:hypothetical protein [Halobacteriovorax sp.]|uniref:hypothetical protein n=1 Tax=Halobacteriovorax sp. TaxID=2020862 RepID=UPI003564F616